ncbi:MAG: hypothetical protein K1060chlam5_00916 [Candidatus Anoxychlamydiales bacterium]|nr:hypothetical protein [Candidatus Anoxychlamydiales bacterium]
MSIKSLCFEQNSYYYLERWIYINLEVSSDGKKLITQKNQIDPKHLEKFNDAFVNLSLFLSKKNKGKALEYREIIKVNYLNLIKNFDFQFAYIKA